ISGNFPAHRAPGAAMIVSTDRGISSNELIRPEGCSNAHLSPSWHAHVDADITVPVAIAAPRSRPLAGFWRIFEFAVGYLELGSRSLSRPVRSRPEPAASSSAGAPVALTMLRDQHTAASRRRATGALSIMWWGSAFLPGA